MADYSPRAIAALREMLVEGKEPSDTDPKSLEGMVWNRFKGKPVPTEKEILAFLNRSDAQANRIARNLASLGSATGPPQPRGATLLQAPPPAVPAAQVAKNLGGLGSRSTPAQSPGGSTKAAQPLGGDDATRQVIKMVADVLNEISKMQKNLVNIDNRLMSMEGGKPSPGIGKPASTGGVASTPFWFTRRGTGSDPRAFEELNRTFISREARERIRRMGGG